MVEIADIKDPESRQKWQRGFFDDEEERRNAAVAIALRAALRVLPIAWQWFSSKEELQRDLTAMPVLRSALFAMVTAKCQTMRIGASLISPLMTRLLRRQ